MRKLVLLVAFCTALPLLAEDQQESSSEAPPPPATQAKPESSSQAPPPAASQTKPAPPTAPKLKGLAAAQPVDPDAAGKTIEEIIARVNNEIITLSEYEKGTPPCPHCGGRNVEQTLSSGYAVTSKKSA